MDTEGDQIGETKKYIILRGEGEGNWKRKELVKKHISNFDLN